MMQGEKALNSIIYSDVNFIDGNGKDITDARKQTLFLFYKILPRIIKELPDGNKFDIYKGRDVLRATIQSLCPAGPFLTMAYPRTLFDSVEGYNSVHLTDPDVHFTFKILQQFPSVIWIRESLFEYRVHGNNQLDIQAKQASIKKPIDKYLYTVDLSDNLLRSLDLDREVIITTFVKKYLIDEMFHYLARGNLKQAYSGYMFGLATYPGRVFRTPRSYSLAILLLLGPLSAPITRLIRSMYHFLEVKKDGFLNNDMSKNSSRNSKTLQ